MTRKLDALFQPTQLVPIGTLVRVSLGLHAGTRGEVIGWRHDRDESTVLLRVRVRYERRHITVKASHARRDRSR